MSLSSRVSDLASSIGTALSQLRTAVASAYTKPLSGVPKKDLESSIQSSLDKADNAVPTAAAGNQQVFFKNASGSLGGLAVTTASTASVLVQRQSNGHIIVPGTPAASTDATSKQYTDATFALVGRAIATGTGLTGGGTLAADRTISLTAAVQTSLGKADTAVQPAGLTKAAVGLGNVDNTSDANKPVSSATATALAAKADLVSGVIPTSQIPALAVTDVFPVTSQAQMLALTAQRGDVAIRSDVNATFILATDSPSTLADWKPLPMPNVPVQSVNGQTGTVVLGKSDVGLGNVDNTSDANKPVSTAQQSALDLKAPLASPAFTGTPTGITKSHVGLGNVDNTADADKPVSTAQQSALDSKAPTASPSFTGTVSGVTKSMVGLSNVDNTSDANKPLSTAQRNYVDQSTPAGVVLPFAGSSAPSGFLLANGGAVSRSTYSNLFSVIGTTYGAGNGSTTFNLPDMRGSFPVGLGANGFTALNQSGGSTSHSHDLNGLRAGAQLEITDSGSMLGITRASPTGNWTPNVRANGTASGSYPGRTNTIDLTGRTETTTSTPPYLTLNFIVKT